MKILPEICTNCGLCVENCPMEAVLPPRPGERWPVPTILANRCTECVGHFAWPRCAALCPMFAVRRNLDDRETRPALLAKWLTLSGWDVYEWTEPPALEPALETGEAGA